MNGFTTAVPLLVNMAAGVVVAIDQATGLVFVPAELVNVHAILDAQDEITKVVGVPLIVIVMVNPDH